MRWGGLVAVEGCRHQQDHGATQQAAAVARARENKPKNNNQPIAHRVARGDRSSYAKVTTGYFIQVAMKQQQQQQDAALYAPSALLCCAIYSKR